MHARDLDGQRTHRGPLEPHPHRLARRTVRALQGLTCEASREHIESTLADPVKDNPMGIDVYEVEPRLRDLGYRAKAGGIVEDGGPKATGNLAFRAENRFEVDDRGAVERLQVVDADPQAVDLGKRHPVQADRVRAVG